jgi:ribosomal protein S12 methylthiotransferase accessory factor
VLHQWQRIEQGKRIGLGVGRVSSSGINCNHFYNDQFWGDEFANAAFVHYPDERWFKPGRKDALAERLLDAHCLQIYNPDGELRGSHLYDTNSGNLARGICALPFVRQSDGAVVYFPTNLIDNLFLSNGMSAGNTLAKRRCSACRRSSSGR